MTDKDNILHENMVFTPEFGGDLADYATGKGIFMRNIGQLNRTLPGYPFFDFIKNNATAVWCNRLPGDKFTFN